MEWASLAPIEYPPRMEEFRHALPALPRLWASWAGVSLLGKLHWREDCSRAVVALIGIGQNSAPGNCLARILDLAVVNVEEVAAWTINIVWTKEGEVRVRFSLILIIRLTLVSEEVGGGVVGEGVSAGGLWGVKLYCQMPNFGKSDSWLYIL